MLLAWVQISELDLFISQLGAWAEMINDRQEQGLQEAVRSTFSGETPCEKCMAIAQEKEERQKETSTTKETFNKIKFSLPKQPEHVRLKSKILPLPKPCFFFIMVKDVTIDLELPPPQLG